MAEEEVEEPVPRTPRPVLIRNCTVLVGEQQVPDEQYPVGNFETLGAEGGEVSVAIIAIAEVDNRVVVAVPFETWHRVAARRVLPAQALVKPLPFTVELVDRSVAPEERSDTHFETIKVWVGVLAPWAEESVYYEPEGSEAEVPDYSFSSGEPNLLPSAAGLEKIFSQQYQFASATSGGGGRPPAASGVEQRLTSLEQSLQSVVQSLQRLSGENPRTVTNAKAAPAPCAPPPGLPRRPAGGGAVDLSVVQAARDAGVPEAQIQEMAALAMQGRSTMADVPKPPPRERRGKKNILSESEEDEVPAVEEVAEVVSGGEVLTTAVQKLTEIAAHLTVEKKKGRTLDALLDGVGSVGGSDAASSTSSRKYSVALRALRRAVEKQPEELYKVLEKNMDTDFHKVSQMPGSSPVQVSARAWLEMRSKVQGYQTPVRLLWGIAGILDALKAERFAEARCRAGLLLAAGDQMSIDRGSWLVASELLLEDPPPMGAFNAHVLPTESEPPYTRLIDSRWLELVLAKLSDIDSLNEKKKKLNFRKALNNAENAEIPKAPPKKGGKGGGKGEKAGSGKDTAPENN